MQTCDRGWATGLARAVTVKLLTLWTSRQDTQRTVVYGMRWADALDEGTDEDARRSPTRRSGSRCGGSYETPFAACVGHVR